VNVAFNVPVADAVELAVNVLETFEPAEEASVASQATVTVTALEAYVLSAVSSTELFNVIV
jgi:hypothetical protein